MTVWIVLLVQTAIEVFLAYIHLPVGLMLTGTQLWVFHELLPLAILGYLVKDKRQLFT